MAYANENIVVIQQRYDARAKLSLQTHKDISLTAADAVPTNSLNDNSYMFVCECVSAFVPFPFCEVILYFEKAMLT